MKTSRDPDTLIKAFLDEGVNELPDRSFDVVRASIERTRQRAAFGPWRKPIVNKLVTFGLAAAAVVLAVVIGIRFLPSNGGVGVQPTASPTPATTTEPTSALAPTPTFLADPTGRLQPGVTYVVHPFDGIIGMDARSFSFVVPSQNWQAAGGPGRTTGVTWDSGEGESGGVGIGFLKVHSLNSDACNWATDEDIAIGPTANDLLEALDGSDNVELTTDGSDVVTLTMPATLALDDIDCDETDYRIWNAEGFDIPAQGPSNIWLLGIDDFGGRHVILRSYMPDTPDEVIRELERIVLSIQVSNDPGCSQYDHNCN